MLRWEYKEPLQNVLLMHDDTIERYSIKNNKATRDSSAKLTSLKIVFQEILMWLKGEFSANPDFSVSLDAGSGSITLLPKAQAMKGFIKAIELEFTPGKYLIIKHIKIIENKENYIIIKFSNVQVNEDTREALFRKIK